MIVAPRSFAGYLQSKGTTEGFQRMKRRGIVLPPFQIEQNVSKAVRLQFESILADMTRELFLASASTGAGVASDAMDPIDRELIRMLKARLREIAERDKSYEIEGEEELRKQLSRQLSEAQKAYFADFFEDASEKMKTRIAYALDKDKVFEDRLDGIRAGYLDSAVERISEGKSWYRKRFITMLSDWIQGERPDLDGIDNVIDKIRGEGDTFSKFFARDQFSRFSQALTFASYAEGGAKWIRIVTVGDARVRKTHKVLHGKIFAINDLPKEVLDFNERCGRLPVFELTKNMVVSKGDGISLA